jgi:HD-GYP domain-containing protein (c-di-GMP phosphodiesterase class II)
MAMHQIKTAYTAAKIADKLGFSRPRKRDLVYAALLHDVGALSPEEKSELHSADPGQIQRHTRRGRIVLSRVPLLERCSVLIERHHERWSSLRRPTESEGFDANIIALADSLELSISRGIYILFQSGPVRRALYDRRGSDFAPEVVDAFMEVSVPEEFWFEFASPSLPSDFAGDGKLVDYRCSISEFAPISTLVRDIIDFRSTFTATHSSGVAASVGVAGKLLGFSDEDCLALTIAGNLHDIGKMAIPSAILNKPGPLDRNEETIIRQHPYLTSCILTRAGVPVDIVEWAAWHHERLDGSGYPRRAQAIDIRLGSRIMMVMDVFTALAEERPYRPAMKPDAVRDILRAQAADGKLEPSIVELVSDSHAEINQAMREAQTKAADFYREKLG